MKLNNLIFFIIILFFFFRVESAYADFSKNQLSTLGRLESYLKSIKTLRADFSQFSNDGKKINGKIYLSRPGKIRFEYDKPSPILIVGNKGWVIYENKEINQIAEYPIKQTPLAFLLEKEFSFNIRNININKLVVEKGYIEINILHKNSFNKSSLTIIFENNPINLRKWNIVDPQGNSITINLFNIEKNITIDKSLFVFTYPPNYTGPSKPQTPDM